jgi:hypothetical protein
MAGAMGYKYGLQREDAPDYEAELPKARQEFKAYKDHLKKKRERERAKGRSK